MSSDGRYARLRGHRGSEISFETGKMAKQANGAVVVRQGDTMVLATGDRRQPPRRRLPPAHVDVEERMYAAGKIPAASSSARPPARRRRSPRA